MNTIMIIGYGSVGQYVLDIITRNKAICNEDTIIHVVSRKTITEVAPRLNVTKVSAMINGFKGRIEYHQCDVSHIDELAEILSSASPDIIAYCGRLYSGVKYGSFSYPRGIGYGVWLPLAVPLIHKVMKAVKLSGITTKVINTSYPDATNFILKSVGLVPFTGAGNLNHLVPRIVMAANELHYFDKLITTDDIQLTGGHYLNTAISNEGHPNGADYILKIDNSDISYTTVADEIFSRCKLPMEKNHVRNLMVASDVAEIILMVSRGYGAMHLPGANGDLGGSKYIYSEGKLSSTEYTNDAEKVNLQNTNKDGILRIDSGYVNFMDDDIDKLKTEFDIECPKSININDFEEYSTKEVIPKLKLFSSNQMK